MSTTQLRNIGPKSAAWLRQVGLHTEADLRAAGAVGAFMKIKRAGFRPSLNLLYALEGALLDCHWQDITVPRRQAMAAEVEAVSAALPPPRGRPVAAPVTTTHHVTDSDDGSASFDSLDDKRHDD